jgi:N-acetylglucosaminyldiphosphoundecaprenol N-acetyl-beta-D-mannosaminyltransferase
VAKQDDSFKNALANSDVLLPDGEGIITMVKILKGEKVKKIAGADIHDYLLRIANQNSSKCFYLGSSEQTLKKIKQKLELEYSNINFEFFSPPFKVEFSDQDNKKMISAVNHFKPDFLFIGMTAPKQEKWVVQHKNYLDAKVIASIGAVFDFVAQTKKRAPLWMIKLKMEWLYRALTSWRLTKRYLYSNPIFLLEIAKLYLLKILTKKDMV